MRPACVEWTRLGQTPSTLGFHARARARLLGPQLQAATMQEQHNAGSRADLDLDLAIQFKDVARFRASYYVKHSGIAASFRLVPSRVPSLTELGLPEVLWRLADRRSGLVLVAGPVCNGKTTTAAAMVDHVNKTRPAHVLTLENPIEFVHESSRAQITQREIGVHAPTFAAALKSAPRENPDVLVVSDLPGPEDVEPQIGLSALESIGLTIDPATGTVTRVEN